MAHYYVGNGNNELLWYSPALEDEANIFYKFEFPGGYAVFQESDQNFVLYARAVYETYDFKQDTYVFNNKIVPVWDTNTANQGSNESELVVQPDGNVVMYEKSNMKGNVLWSTNTADMVELYFDDYGRQVGVRINVATGNFIKFEIAISGTYYLEAVGGQGGNAGNRKGGRGAMISGSFKLRKGDVLRVVIGGKGSDGLISGDYGSGSGGGGGGASSVVLVDGNFDSLADEDDTKLIIAGGGGGAGWDFGGK